MDRGGGGGRRGRVEAERRSSAREFRPAVSTPLPRTEARRFNIILLAIDKLSIMMG